ncbi:MAG: aldehyde dehydrogenase [Deltaproteobacteria bacterium]|nr:aldehyde dehydrogenase [Deltaproteobacteria bacterium]
MDEYAPVGELLQRQREYFESGITQNVSWRIQKLRALKWCLLLEKEQVFDALKSDLCKSKFEAFATELSFVIQELDHTIRNIRQWARPKRVATPLAHHPAKSFIYSEPYGIVLIIGPWNYPFQLMIAPLIPAIAAGNSAILKPSELAPRTSAVLAKLISRSFDRSHVAVVEGGPEETQVLLKKKFDYIFFTGGNRVGQIVMEAAAKNLTPLTLELGGKSPAIVDWDADIGIAARRITWGKFINTGQTCIAPDHVLVHKSVKKALVDAMKSEIESFYGKDPSKSPDYGRIINEGHFDRLSRYLEDGHIAAGGQANREEGYIAPTMLDEVSRESQVMKEEIFGPILPVLEYERLEDVISDLRGREKPLALYFFSKSRDKQKRVLRDTSSGGVAINNVIVQITPRELPFGGVGYSGMGKYHGKAGFDTFSNSKGVYRQRWPIDVPLKYPPYGERLRWMKSLFRWFA